MYRTKEMRWFFKDKNRNFESWFQRNELSFENNEERTDYYLDIENDDLNVKLREGKIEVKQRKHGPRARTILNESSGYCDDWTKWSFDVENSDSNYVQIIDGSTKQWIEVIKNRLAIKVNDQDMKPTLHPNSVDIDYGCQIEYALVKVKNQLWYTFGLEWFGDCIYHLPKDFIQNIFGESRLCLNQSMGYASFLYKTV